MPVSGAGAYSVAQPGHAFDRGAMLAAEKCAFLFEPVADPFTERVQRGDKALYRARFAGFERQTAEKACKQLKRSNFECVALKN